MKHRSARKGEFDVMGRLHLVENDLDEHDSILEELRKELTRIKLSNYGILVSIVVASIVYRAG